MATERQNFSHIALSEEVDTDPAVTPDRFLVCSMIERAVLDLRSPMKGHCESAFLWFFDESDDPEGERAFSFVWCCEFLQLSTKTFREKLSARVAAGNVELYSLNKIKLL